MTEPIVTTGQLGAYLAGDPQSALDMATAAVRAYCGWHVAPSVTEAVTVPVDGPCVALLPSLHVTAVSEVKLDDDVIPATDYEWFGHGVVRGRFQRGYSKMTVSLTHGYESVPEVAAVILAVSSRAIVSPSGVVRAQVGQISETYSQTGSNQAGGVALLDGEMATLDRYKIPPRP